MAEAFSPASRHLRRCRRQRAPLPRRAEQSARSSAGEWPSITATRANHKLRPAAHSSHRGHWRPPVRSDQATAAETSEPETRTLDQQRVNWQIPRLSHLHTSAIRAQSAPANDSFLQLEHRPVGNKGGSTISTPPSTDFCSLRRAELIATSHWRRDRAAANMYSRDTFDIWRPI